MKQKPVERRSRFAQGLNVPNRVRLGLSLAAALLDGLLLHPRRSTVRCTLSADGDVGI
jgi:hypothetical protein